MNNLPERTYANGWPCKHETLSGGDWVPYGSSGAYLPTMGECDNPNIPYAATIDDCESCQYYEPDPDYDPDLDPTYEDWCGCDDEPELEEDYWEDDDE